MITVVVFIAVERVEKPVLRKKEVKWPVVQVKKPGMEEREKEEEREEEEEREKEEEKGKQECRE